MIDFEYLNLDFLAGVDEVGRGPLAGPVVAACAIISGGSFDEQKEIIENLSLLGVTDSKKLTSKRRIGIIENFGFQIDQLVCDKILSITNFKNCTLQVVICEISPALIDQMNILAASLEAMAQAFVGQNLDGKSGWILVDGTHKLKHSWSGVKQEALVKGDSRSVMIALASIFAKEYRDHLMKKLATIYPGYGLEAHAGYPTPSHKEAIKNLGVTPVHRKSFRGVKEFV